jgi:hypothetical protein
MRNNIGKKTWGVLGKQQTYYYQPGLVGKNGKTPLNANAFDAWDAKKSKYRRVDLVPRQMDNDGQQAGVVPQVSSGPVVSPTVTPTNTNTPTNTTTITPTPSITPSSTPYPLPIQPALWYDSTNLGSIDYITSGGTNYVAAWRSLGTYSKTITGATTNTMPIWSGSSQMPGAPLIVRFSRNANPALQSYLTQRFDSTLIPQTGITVFQVMAKPPLMNYSGATNANGWVTYLQILSGNTTTGGFSTAPNNMLYQLQVPSNSVNTMQTLRTDKGYAVNLTLTAFSSTSLNDKYLITNVFPTTGEFPYFEINQSGGTFTTSYTASSYTSLNQVNLGVITTSGGTITGSLNMGGEVGEIMVFNRVLSPSEQEQVQDYLRDKWRYNEWASPVPTPTPTKL